MCFKFKVARISSGVMGSCLFNACFAVCPVQMFLHFNKFKTFLFWILTTIPSSDKLSLHVISPKLLNLTKNTAIVFIKTLKTQTKITNSENEMNVEVDLVDFKWNLWSFAIFRQQRRDGRRTFVCNCYDVNACDDALVVFRNDSSANDFVP
ncbi:CLUMA_CG013882, isoform A [Clunio marinus]|uniref:CLUMA_CG013882, isoform A n=1 Tax=Clunio marinus TaxID=568069 RepID=A0A1J1INF1_9DIPT|nr:CLUMA_CG013882, isoform A [Clunio marinus]